MADMVRISVIVPIYKVEDYLEKCLDSLLSQTFSDFEVLLVNDGSPDRSPEIARKYAAGDSRFRLIDKENGGVASARNAGLDAAQGDYIAFVDADDFVQPEYLSTLYAAAVENKADIVCCNFNIYYPGTGTKHPHFLTRRPGVYSSQTLLKSLLHDVTVQGYLWNRLWKRSLFEAQEIRFPKIRFEDMAVALQLFYFAGKVVLLPDALYNYTQRGNSAVHTFRPESENDFLCSFALMRLFLEEEGVYPQYRRPFAFYMVKSQFFMWGVIFLMHLGEKNFRGIWGNLRRSTAFLHCYAQKRLPAAKEQPDYQSVIGAPPERPVPIRKRRRLTEGE